MAMIFQKMPLYSRDLMKFWKRTLQTGANSSVLPAVIQLDLSPPFLFEAIFNRFSLVDLKMPRMSQVIAA